MILQVGVKVLIQNTEGKYLLLARSEKFSVESETSEKSWDIPGGRIDPMESHLDALRREAREEIGVELSGEPELLAAQDIFVEAKDLHVVRLTYRLAADIQEITLSDEHSEYGWFTLEEVRAKGVEPYLASVLENIAQSVE